MSMFESGDLYGTFQSEQQPQQQPQMESQLPLPPPVQQHKPPPPEKMYYHEEPKQVIYYQSESFFDKIAAKRFEILKVFSFALIIVLAISIDRVSTHYLAQYVTNSVLTGTQELLLRISYPITVLIIIWLLKLL